MIGCPGGMAGAKVIMGQGGPGALHVKGTLAG